MININLMFVKQNPGKFRPFLYSVTIDTDFAFCSKLVLNLGTDKSVFDSDA